jgi:hypothetical protein
MNRRSLILLLLFAGSALAQQWYDETWADPLEKRKNTLSGNLVRTTFYNTALVGRVGSEFSFEWPKSTGDEYIGDISVLVGVEYFNPLLREEVTSVAVTQSPARGRDEVNPANPSEYWTFMPLPGFASPDTNLVAMSHQRVSWPQVWPDKGWPGSWNGYFGRDVQNADQETYFWVDDSRDMEFMSKEMAYRTDVDSALWVDHFPTNPDSALVPRIQPFEGDSLHGGLGLKVAVRGFQWSHVLAEDVVFWLYDITNASDIDYDKVVFGMVCGTLVGGDGDSGDDINWFDLAEEFTYTGDNDDRGASGWVPVHPGVRNVGYVGYAFLESPDNNTDWIDSDGDSGQSGDPGAPRLTATVLEAMLSPRSLVAGEPVIAIDYNDPFYPRSVVRVPSNGDTLEVPWRDQVLLIHAGALVAEDPTNLVDDNFNGVIDESPAYEDNIYVDWTLLGVDLGPLDQGLTVPISAASVLAWDPLVDERRDDGFDNDGDWDPENDDLGGDGQPATGDAGEGDGVPSPGEPHFDALDITESDQIGLTSFNEFTFPEFSSRNDNDIWSRMIPGEFDSTAGVPADVDFLYGSGYFPLRAGETKRISLAVVFGESVDDLYSNLATVRTIYNENYNFLQPPAKPKVNAVAGDRQVTLYWDDAAEKSVDRISGLRDFQGYRIYRATDAGFLDSYSITDGQGTTSGFKPIAQFDLIDDIQGYFDLPLNGTQYYLGSNTGLAHTWTDTTVVNGQAYFYAVTSYDAGDPVAGFLPSECAKQASIDEAGRVTLDVNTAYVTPSEPASGYTPPLVMDEAEHIAGSATGNLLLQVIDEQQLVDGAEYRVTVLPDTTGRLLDVIGWEYTAWQPDTHFVWNQELGGYIAVLDSIPFDSTRVLLDEITAKAFAWTIRRDGQSPASESYIINKDTPQQRLVHPGVLEGSLSAVREDTGDALRIWINTDTGDTLDADGHFSFSFDEGKVTYRDAFLATLGNDEVVNVLFLYEYNLVHKRLVMDLTGYATRTANFLPVVEGVRLDFRNDWRLMADPEQSGWTTAVPDTLIPLGLRPLALLDFSNGLREVNGTPQPHDYRLTFTEPGEGAFCLPASEWFDQTMTQTLNRLVPPLQTSLIVEDITDPENPLELDFWLYNAVLNEGNPSRRRDPTSPFDGKDAILVREPVGPNGSNLLTWLFQSEIPFDTLTMSLPLGGEVYTAVTRKPFTAEDEFHYTVQAPSFDRGAAANTLKDIRVVPNPYLATATWESKPIKGNRGARKVQFTHLPPVATVRIYTIRGELVQTLHHESRVWDGSLDWNLKSKEGLDVAYGVYIYHVDSPAGETVGKFALIK